MTAMTTDTQDTTPESSTPVEPADRRATLEAAFEAADSAEMAAAKTTTEEPKGGHVDAQTIKPTDVSTSKTDVTADAPGSKSSQSSEAVKLQAPQSWKPAQKAKWDKLDVDIQQEVLRRERDTTHVLNETASARQLVNKFTQAVNPYMARINLLGGDPIQAVQELLKADHLLSSAPKGAKAQFMAKLINDYGIDLQELDNALAGKPVADPVDSRVEQLVAQRLAPLQEFITAQQRAEQQRQQEIGQQLSHTVETMAADPAYPHFQQVRESMADIVELMARRGQHITIEAAYNRAIAMDPDLAKLAEQEATAKAAAQLNSRAQRAKNASISVGGAPSGSIGGTPRSNDRRATIEAAFEQFESR